MFRRSILTTARSARAIPKRKMGGHAEAHPTEGFEGLVRKYLPGNHHVIAKKIKNHALIFEI